jgi:hypothetical protein
MFPAGNDVDGCQEKKENAWIEKSEDFQKVFNIQIWAVRNIRLPHRRLHGMINGRHYREISYLFRILAGLRASDFLPHYT